MKRIDENQLWSMVIKAFQDLPYRVEVPLSMLSSVIWPSYDENKTKYWNQILCRVLRQHGAIITKRNGRRFVSFPKHILEKPTRKGRKSMKTSEPEHVLVSEAWRW
jgi:hypothetical protein